MTLKIVHISDSHLQKLPELPEADLLIHTGDALNYGSFDDLIEFRKQLLDIHHQYDKILFLPGNHDWVFQRTFDHAKDFLLEDIDNIEVMHEKFITYKGYKIYGTSFQPFFCDWAFNIRNPELLAQIYERIPEDTEILLTHCPPKNILDNCIWERVGSPELAHKLQSLPNLKLHCFGHIHAGQGMLLKGSTVFSNGAICDENYDPTNPPNIIQLESKNV